MCEKIFWLEWRTRFQATCRSAERSPYLCNMISACSTYVRHTYSSFVPPPSFTGRVILFILGFFELGFLRHVADDFAGMLFNFMMVKFPKIFRRTEYPDSIVWQSWGAVSLFLWGLFPVINFAVVLYGAVKAKFFNFPENLDFAFTCSEISISSISPMLLKLFR